MVSPSFPGLRLAETISTFQTYGLLKISQQELYENKESATDSFGIHCKKLLKEEKIDVGEIAINSIPDVPI